MPGKPVASRNATTLGVRSPRSSAMIFACGNAARTERKKSSPGALIHSPVRAVGALAGIRQYASNPRKWSMRTTSHNANEARNRACHHA